MSYTEERPASAAEKILAASKELRRTLSEVRDENPGLTDISVRVGGRVEESESGESSASVARELVITIHAESQAHAEEHGNQLEAQGCHCTSTGPTDVECDCSDVP